MVAKCSAGSQTQPIPANFHSQVKQTCTFKNHSLFFYFLKCFKLSDFHGLYQKNCLYAITAVSDFSCFCIIILNKSIKAQKVPFPPSFSLFSRSLGINYNGYRWLRLCYSHELRLSGWGVCLLNRSSRVQSLSREYTLGQCTLQ